jgi:hypothetical protein
MRHLLPLTWMKDGARLENKVCGVPKEIDREIGRLKLAVIVIGIDGYAPRTGSIPKVRGYGNVGPSVKEERRQYPRAIAHWPVILETTQGIVTGITMDVSAGGAFICCREPLRVRERHFMAMHNVPVLDRSLPVEVEVVRSNIRCTDDELLSHGIGVRFSEIADEDREFINILVSDHLEEKDMNLRE